MEFYYSDYVGYLWGISVALVFLAGYVTRGLVEECKKEIEDLKGEDR